MGNTGNGGQLNYTAKLDISQVQKNAERLKKIYSDLAVSATGIVKSVDQEKASIQATTDAIKARAVAEAGGIKPLTEYQQKQLEIKQQVVDLAKAKQDADRADKQASLDKMQALRDERLAREQINTQIAANRLALQQAAQTPAKRTTEVSNSQAEVDAYNRSKNELNVYTSAINAQTVARARLTAENAKAAAVTNNLSLVQQSSVSSSNSQASATKAVTLTKQQLAQALAEEKYRQQQSTAELKNNAREMLNAKGSAEQRRAALIRLTTEYDRLSKADRESSWGIRLKNTITGVSDQIKQLEFETNRYGRNVGNYGGAAAAFFTSIKDSILSSIGPMAAFSLAVSAAKAAFHNNVEISDSFVDVQRTAKLSADQVDSLADKLKKIDTRTDLEHLLDIGFIGGRLGVAKDDLVGFIQEVDELAVVLKKEFPGGADAVVTALGKIISVYKITQNEGLSTQEALRKVGSAILEVSHNGGATVQYLQEFSLKTASIAAVAKISLPTILAYGAVLSKAGVQASTAATGVTRLISDLSTKRDKYFAIAQLADSTLTLEKFTNLINTDTNAALEAFFKGLKAGNPTQTETADRLQTLHLTAGRVKSTVISLAEAQEQLSEKTAIANKGYADGTSVAHNFELANNTLAAAFEKLGNKISNAFVDSGAERFLANIIDNIVQNKTEAEQLSDAYSVNKQRLDDLEGSLKPLVERYDELRKFTVRNKDEQAELRDVTAQIGELLPGVVTKFDNYGNAIDINRGKIENLTKAQRDLLELQNRSAVKTANSQFDQAQKYLPEAKAAAERAAKLEQNSIDRFFDYFSGGDSDKEAKQAARDRITKLSGQAYEAAKAIRSLGGELTKAQKEVLDYYEAVNKPKTTPKTPATIVGDGEDTTATDTPVARTVDDIKADIKKINDLKKPLDVASKQYKDYVEQLKGFKKELKLAEGGKDTEAITAENQYKTALKGRNDLQAKISELTKKGTDKQLTADEQEVESVKDKYKKMIEAAITFNNDPANKKKGLKVDGSGLLRAESREEDAVRDKQATDKLKVELDKQKGLYDEYEAYKLKVGKENADKYYKDQIDTNLTYLESLKAKKQELENGDTKAKGGSDSDRAKVQLQLKLIDDQISAEESAQKKAFQDFLFQFRTYESERKYIIQTGLDAEKKLRDKGYNDEADNVAKNTQDSLDELDTANFKGLDAYKDFFDNVDTLSTASAQKQIANLYSIAQIRYVTGKMSLKSFAEITKLLDNSSKAIKDRLPQGLRDIGSAFSDLGSKIGEFDDAFGKVLKTAGSLLSNLGEIKSSINTLNNGKASAFDKVSAGFNFVGAIWSATTALEGFFLQSDQKYQDAVYKNQKEVDAIDAVNKALQRQIALTKQLYGGDLIKGYLSDLNSLTAAQEKNQKSLQGKLGLTGNHELDLEIGSHNLGLGIYDSELNRLVKLGKIADLSKLSIEELNQLLDKKLLDDKSAAIVQSMIDLDQQIKDTQNALNESLTGTSFDSLLDGIVSLFQNATTSAEDFGKNFQKIIQDSLLNSFKRDYLGKQLQGFYDNLAELTKEHGTLSKDDIASLQDQYNTILANANQQFINLQKATGITFDANADSSSARAQVSASLTEDTATRSYGVWAGTQVGVLQVRDEVKALSASFAQSFTLARDHFNVTVQIEANTRRGADNTDGLIPALKEIIKNTNGTSLRGSGLGQ